MDLGQDVLVIGGGNVAYDVARTVLRQTAYDTARAAARLPGTRRVRLVSLETLEEMPADTVEIREGDEEGIERINGWGPVEIERDSAGAVTGVVFRRCVRVYDEARRFHPVYEDTQRQNVPCDTVLIAAGQTTDLSFLDEGGTDVEQFRPGWPKVDAESLAATAPGVFVAGDLAHGTRLLIDAVASGKRAARSVYGYVTGRPMRPEYLETHIPLDRYRRELGYELLRRVDPPSRPTAERLADPRQTVEMTYGEAEARREASRCLDCGVTPVFDGMRCVLCGGCADVCPTSCLKLAPLDALEPTADLDAIIVRSLGNGAERAENSVILKDEDRCIRCALCVMRCPVDAITMERVQFTATWSAV
jgi:formate dehydrogenase beta subunit